MKLTEFFRLRMPDGTDPVNIEDFNDNFEVIDRELKKRISDDGSASDVTVGFEVAESRQPLKSGEKLSVLMGKVHRFFTDLKTVAFSGKYGDLSERPSLGGASTLGVANNCTTTEAGFALDARQGKTLMDKSNELSRDLRRVNVYVGGDGKMHFVNSGGADSVLNFNKGKLYTITGIAKGWSGATFSADLKTVCDNWADVKEENIGYGIRSFGKLGGSGNSPGKLTKLGYANGVFTVRVDADLNDCTIDIYFIA